MHELPSTSSRISYSVTIHPGQRISFDDARYRTIQARRFRALANSRVKGRVIGNVSHLSREDYYSSKFASADVDVERGATFEYLQYRAEGTCFVRIDGNVINASPCPTIDTSGFRLEAQPRLQLWIHVAVGNSSRWVLVSKSTVKDVGANSVATK